MSPPVRALTLLLAILAAPAGAAAGERSCFDLGEIRNSRVVDASTIEIRVGSSDRYRLTLARPQVNLGPLDTVGFAARGGPICGARDIEVIGSAGTAVPVRVAVTELEPVAGAR
ncbi:MAG TPA: hypothetical protein VED40_02620 [Azospirillaceae bacterium]|nr:hypothetical protein [Azospirillaceae bacterium]